MKEFMGRKRDATIKEGEEHHPEVLIWVRDDLVERSYRAPCVVLAINDNPYGLMVALSYMCRTCP
jgi:hypothetical protein